ncbi:hypothetical protein D3C81_586680 [compost metagenome]
MQADNQLVADLQALLGSEDVVRRFLEVDDDLRQFLRHALAGAQVERHAGPAPVADVGTQGDKGFGVALGVGIGFFQVPRYRFAFAVAGDVLAAHHLSGQAFRADRRQGLEHFDLLVADAVGGQVGRRVHGDQAEQLQQVILDHVPQLAGLVEVTPAAFDTDLLGHGDFHVGDVILVPLGFEQAVGETQGDQVLDGLFTQIVVDAVGAVLREELRHGVVDLARGFQVRANGFFQHHAGIFRQTDLRQVFADCPVNGGRGRKVGNDPLRAAGHFSQGDVVFGLEEIDMQISQACEKTLDHSFVQLFGTDVAAQLGGDERQVLLLAARLPGQRDDPRVLVQEAGAVKLIKGRKQLSQGQIAEGAEQGKGARFNRNREHDVCSFIKLSYKYLFSRHHSRENVVITTTFSQNTDSEWWSVGAISRIGHRYGPHQRPFLH